MKLKTKEKVKENAKWSLIIYFLGIVIIIIALLIIILIFILMPKIFHGEDNLVDKISLKLRNPLRQISYFLIDKLPFFKERSKEIINQQSAFIFINNPSNEIKYAGDIQVTIIKSNGTILSLLNGTYEP